MNDDSMRAVAPAATDLPTLREVHYPACNYWTKPIGSPGCICKVVHKVYAERDARDAARYRWLREANEGPHWMISRWLERGRCWAQIVDLEDAIDAEMARARDRYPKGQDPQGLGGEAIEPGRDSDAPKES